MNNSIVFPTVILCPCCPRLNKKFYSIISLLLELKGNKFVFRHIGKLEY